MDIKAEGEGEWNARKHGVSKRRIWRKIHIEIDEETLDVRTVEVTNSNVGDSPILPELLNQIPPNQDIGSVTAPSHVLHANHCRTMNGAYDTLKCHEAIAPREAHAVIPPRKNAKPRVALCGDAGVDTIAEAASKRNLSGSCYA